MDFKITVLITTTVINLGLALIIYFKNRHDRINISYSLIVLSVSLWAFTNITSITSKTSFLAKFWSVLSYMSAIFIAAGFLYFSLVFPKSLADLQKYHRKIILFSVPLMCILVSIPGFTIKNISLYPWKISTGPGLFIFALYFFFLMGWAFKNLGSKYRKANEIEKTQLKFVLWGTSISIVFGSLCNLVLPLALNNYNFVWLGPIFTLAMVILFAYAIVKHRLLNIRVIATELFTALIILVFLTQTLLAPNITQLLLRGGMLILVIFFGALLIRSVLQEVKRREQIQVLAQKLEKANKQLKRLDEAKTNFMNIAAHQLRTPISGVKGYLSMLLEGDYGQLQDQQKEIMKKNLEATDRMINLIDVFLDVSKIEVGRLKLIKEEVRPENLISGVIEQLSNLAKKRGLSLKFIKPKKKLSKLLVDPDKIHNVIMNLVDNAIKYTEKGGITVLAEEKDNKIYIHVKDTGIGIPKKEVSTLFQKFSRGRRAVINPSGSGLGLFIVKQLVEAHGGKAWVESEGKGKGSTFSFSLSITKVKKEETNE